MHLNPMRSSKYLSFSIFTILLLSGIFKNECYSQSLVFQKAPKYEVRAVWLTTIGGLDWPHNYAQGKQTMEKQKKEFVNILDKLKSANINTVLLQTRIRGTVIYPSDLEPWDGCMSGIPGKSPGYDPLAFAIEECHKRGMEIQAWIVTVPVGKWNALGCKNIRRKHPKLIIKDGAEGYMDPDNPMASIYIADICKEIVGKYDIDGIHLDYIRYPETWKYNISKNKARENITSIVKRVSYEIKRLKPWVKLSCSPIGKYDDLGRYSSRGWNAYTKGCQDAQNWLKLGFVDQLYPMMYFRGNQFYPFAFDWKENSFGRTVVPGLGIYFLSEAEAGWPAEEIQRQMFVLRANNMGYAFFRTKFFCDDTKEIFSFTKDNLNLYPALIPPMTWANDDKPHAPGTVNVIRNNGCNTITWEDVKETRQGGLMYNVYASRNYPVDIGDVRNLLAQRLKVNKLTLKQEDNLFYAVTSMDRYGNESSPVQQKAPMTKAAICTNGFIKNDGNRMLLPRKGNIMDAEYILVKSFTGLAITTLPYIGEYADIRKIKNGQYVIYSLNRRGVTHRLGFLSVYRGTTDNRRRAK